MAQLNQRTNAVGISIENIVIHVKNAPSFWRAHANSFCSRGAIDARHRCDKATLCVALSLQEL